jgi:hypothetical protein
LNFGFPPVAAVQIRIDERRESAERSLRGRLGERVDKNKKPSQFANYAPAIVKQNCRRFADVERAQLIRRMSASGWPDWRRAS